MKIIILIISLLLSASLSYAEVYKWTDTNGKVYFSDQKPESAEAELIKIEVVTYTNVTFDNSNADVGVEVVMYSTEWCGYCKKARKYFRSNNITFTEYDIEKDAKANRRHKEMGARGVPVILVGKKRMNGFSEAGFERIYN